ncbi:hypothetical protein ADMFC3_00300 [Geovibrio sp. ADMFC3]
MERNKRLIIAAAFFMLTGCVYESTFTCEGLKNGGRSCETVTSNIEYAIEKERTGGEPQITDNTTSDNKTAAVGDELTAYSIKINEENTPVTSKPKTMRVTILPYVDDKGRLNMMKRVHIIIQKPEWILGDYLIVDENTIRSRK